MTEIQIQVPKKVGRILHVLQEAGYEGYVVGGCVRDSILGRQPNDWDITTSALPAQVKALFPRTIDTGIQHGTVTVMDGKEGFEVTTYRVDGKYEDGRHPDSVTFTRSLAEDLLRRDFTINAMAYNETQGLVDLHGGLDDLRQGVIRAVGDPYRRFSEDALRILRAFRFAAQLGYGIEEGTRRAAAELAPNLRKISRERIRVELDKTLVSDHPGILRDMVECGLTAQFLPELDRAMATPQNNPHHCASVGEHTIRALELIRPDRILRTVMLMHDLGKPDCRVVDAQGIDHFYGHEERGAKLSLEILRRLKYDNETIRTVSHLVRFHDHRAGSSPVRQRKLIALVGAENLPALLEIQRADVGAQSDYQREKKLRAIDELQSCYAQCLERGYCLCLRDLAVSGSDLIDAGMRPGREIGELLSRMLDDVLAQPEHNSREYLLGKYCRERQG